MNFDFVKVIVRRLRLIRVNRNLLVYLIFLGISIGFWFLQTFKEDMNVALYYRLVINNVPENVIFTSQMPEEIKVNVTGHGWSVLQQLAVEEERIIEINFSEVNQNEGRIHIDANLISRAIQKAIPKDLRFVSASPNKIEAFYSNGHHKRVPVIFDGKINTEASRYECGIIFNPDSVDIYAPKHILDSINSIKTVHMTFEHLGDTLNSKLPLKSPKGVKVVPDSVPTTICVDLFTEKSLQVPIYSENTPNNTLMRTFPLQASVTTLVSSSNYEYINEEDFLLVVDYNDVKPNDNKCKIHVRQKPNNIRRLRVSPEYVEFVIERQAE